MTLMSQIHESPLGFADLTEYLAALPSYPLGCLKCDGFPSNAQLIRKHPFYQIVKQTSRRTVDNLAEFLLLWVLCHYNE